MSRKIKRRYGLPYEGFMSSVPAHMCPNNKAWGNGTTGTQSSINMLYDPVDGKFFRRPGSANVGGTSGVLEAVTPAESYRARKMIELTSPSLADGYPTHCVLYTDETNHISALYVRSTNGADSNYQLGDEFSATHYPTAAGSPNNIKCIPYYRTTTATTGDYGRLNSADLRSYALAGSRGMQEAGDYIYFPCLNSIPMRWNRRWNDETGTGSENLRLMPTGGIPPLGYPKLTAGSVDATGDWKQDDAFYYSVAYQYADGSVSLPMIPRSTNDVATTGYIEVPQLANSCNYVTWSKIPVGPDGVVGRWLLRTPKYNATLQTGALPSPVDLYTTAYIGNNTQTTYVDPNGNDLSLKPRPDIIRFDRIWQPPARYIGNFDGRMIVGYTKPNPAALLLAPMEPTALVPSLSDYDDDHTALDDALFTFTVDGTNLKLRKNGVDQVTVALANKTLQQVVDTIHNSGTNNNLWSAAVVPGADSGAPATSLAVTAAANTGDASGEIRCYAPSYPGIAYYKTTAYLGNFPTAKTRWFFTQGGPGVPSNLADSYLAGNYRSGLASWGILQGFAPLLDGCLIFFSKAVVLFRNIKSGKSGVDDDYHPDDLFTNIGCIAWDSIAYGDGWAGCLTDRGYMVFDGTRGGARVISSDIYNAATGVGEWAYEIGQSEQACGADSDASHFHARVMGGKLYCTYRLNSASSAHPNRMIVYDFSSSATGTGLDQVLRPDGKPWGWSTPLTLSLSVLGEVRKANGVARYGAGESTPTPGSGRVDQFETGADDDDQAIIGRVYGPIDFAESMNRKQAQEFRVIHKSNPADNGSFRFHFFRTDGTTVVTETGIGLNMPSTGSGTFARTIVPVPQSGRSPAMGNQFYVEDNGTGSDTSANAAHVWGAELDEIETSGYR